MHTHSIMHTYMHTYIIYICLHIYLCVYIPHTYHRTHNYRTTLFLMKEYQWRDHLKWLFFAEFTNYRTMYANALISHGMRHVLPQPQLMSPSTLARCSCRTPCSSPGSWLQWPCPYSPAPALAARTRSTSAALPPSRWTLSWATSNPLEMNGDAQKGRARKVVSAIFKLIHQFHMSGISVKGDLLISKQSKSQHPLWQE